MSDSDRGAYAPNEGPLAFDARRPVRGGGGPPPMTLIISGLILVVLVGAIAFFYRSGLRAENGAPRPVGTAVGDIKAPPPAAAQPEAPGQGLQIYHAEDGQPGQAGAAPTFTAGPEQPQPRPEPQQVAVAPPAPAPVAAAPLRPAQPTQAAVAPAPQPPKAVAAVAVATPAAPKPAPAVSGAAVVQIGAFSSQALADKGWSAAAGVAPGAAAGKGKRVEAVQKDGQTLYRTSVTGFSSRAEAEAFCVTLKGAGKNCFVK